VNSGIEFSEEKVLSMLHGIKIFLNEIELTPIVREKASKISLKNP